MPHKVANKQIETLHQMLHKTKKRNRLKHHTRPKTRIVTNTCELLAFLMHWVSRICTYAGMHGCVHVVLVLQQMFDALGVEKAYPYEAIET